MSSVMLFVLVVLSSVSVLATDAGDFSIKFLASDYVIYKNESAVYVLEVDNQLPIIDYFTIYSIEPEWSIDVVDESNSVKLYPKQKVNLIVTFSPAPTVLTGSYGIPITVKASKSKISKKATVIIDVLPSAQIVKDYLPAVGAKIAVTSKVDPSKDKLNIVVDLKNQNPLSLSSVKLVLKSDLVDKEYVTSLGPIGTLDSEKTVEFNIPFDPLTPPQDNLLKTLILVEDKGKIYSFDGESKNFEILAYGDIESQSRTEGNALLKKKIITLTNPGNVPMSKSYFVEAGWFKSLFSSPDPVTTRGNTEMGKGYVWDVELSVSETTELIVTTNYWPLLIAIIIIIVIVILYYVLRSPVVIKKSAWISATKHGGISDLNIQIDVKNRGSKVMQNMTVVDKVPNLVDVLKEFKIGTIHPTSILKHERKGTIVKWEIGTFDPHEERVISYRARAKLAVLGQLDLPMAVVKFKKENDSKQYVQSSNQLTIVQK